MQRGTPLAASPTVQMKRVAAGALFALSCVSLAASCAQGTTETAEVAIVEPERIGDAAQPAYESTFRFIVSVKDDGKGKAGGWQKASATMKFADWRHPFSPYFWQCPIAVGMPIRAALHGPISSDLAARITAEIATDVAHDVMHSRESWRGQTAVYCIELYGQMQRMFRDRYPTIGATVARL